MFLDKVVEKRKKWLEQEKKQIPMSVLEKNIENISRRSTYFREYLTKDACGIIAEIKRASPAKGEIAKETFNLIQQVTCYESSSAIGVSVLTEPDYFKGSYFDLQQANQLLTKPLLNKDFIIDAWQIFYALGSGASSILLIAAILTQEQLKEYAQIAKALNLEIILEIHTKEELKRALMLDQEIIIGINNRDLTSLKVSLITTLELAPLVPKAYHIISESGIRNYQQIKLLKNVGVEGVLVGEQIMCAKHPVQTILELVGENDEQN